MGKGYLVRKKIRNTVYLYRQWSWREAGKVRTKTQCLGPVSGSQGSANSKSNTTSDIEFGNPFENYQKPPPPLTDWEVAQSLQRNPFGEHQPPIKPRDQALPIDWARLYGSSDYWTQGSGAKILKKAQSKQIRERKPFTPPPGVRFKGSLSEFGVSDKALAREFESICRQFERFGMDWNQVPRFQIITGRKARWRRSWFQSGLYAVIIPKIGGRTRFKQAYREALADCLLTSLKKHNPTAYREILRSQGRFSPGREAKLRTMLAEVMHKGSKKAKEQFTKEARRQAQSAKDIRLHGEAGKKLLSTLAQYKVAW